MYCTRGGDNILCDICGSKEATHRALIEDTELNVCSACSSYGKVISRIKTELPTKKRKKQATKEEKIVEKAREQIIQVIVPDYYRIIKNKREKLGMKQEDAAKKLGLKESLLHKIETGAFEPNILLARKLERFFKIKLVELHKEPTVKAGKPGGDTFTIGDFIKVK